VLLCSVHMYQVTLRESLGCIRGSELEVCLSPSVLARHTSFHQCSFFSCYSPKRYEIYLLTSLCKLLSSDQREISLATVSSALWLVVIRYIILCFHVVNCTWNEDGKYYFVQFIKMSGQTYFLHLHFVYPEDRNSMFH